MKNILLVLMLLVSGFAAVIETDVGQVELSGVELSGNRYVVAGDTVGVTAVAEKTFTPDGYCIELEPKNLEKFATDLGVPIEGRLSGEITEGTNFTYSLNLPDVLCGDYTVRVRVNYTENGTEKFYFGEFRFERPCKSTRARIISRVVSFVPYPILKKVAGLFGFEFS